MRTLRPLAPFLGLVLALAAAQVPRAQEAGAALPEARAVIDRYGEVTKLREVLARTRSRHETGKFQAGGMSGSSESWSMKPDRKLDVLDFGEGFGRMYAGNDGEVAWMSAAFGQNILKGVDLLQSRLEGVYDAPLKPAALYESMRTLGRETFEGKDCYKIELVAKPLEGMDAAATLPSRTQHEYYEVESGLLIGAEGRTDGELSQGPISRVLSDYKEMAGVLVPTRVKVRQSGMDVILTLEALEFDTVTEAQLQPPIEIQKMLAPPETPKPVPAGEAPKQG